MKYFVSIILSLLFINSRAQTNSYLSDLTSLRSILEKTPSYKDQVKGEALTAYDEMFNRLKADSSHSLSDYNYFYNLAQLFFPIQDNHLGFYQLDKIPKEAEYPRFNGNLDSLKKVLSKKNIDSIEGLYYYGTTYKMGLFKSKEKEYIGVVLDSKTSTWKNGQIAVHLYETIPHYFKAIYADPKYKNLLLYQIEKYSHYTLVNSSFYSGPADTRYNKIFGEPDYINLPAGISDFQIFTIHSTIQYLRLKTFSAMDVDMQKSQAFYDSIKNSLTAPNLILDLRNNEGGAFKVSNKFFKLIEEYTKTGKVYVLVNNGTMSQGEIFTLQLKKLNNVKVLGQTTRGTLTYGSNYGKRERVTSQVFEVYITDMYGDKRLIPYENYGVNPDIILTNKEDWLKQTYKLIRKN